MEVRYGKEVDAIHIYAEKGEYEISEEVGQGVVVDISKDVKVVGIEILDASQRFSPNILKSIILKK